MQRLYIFLFSILLFSNLFARTTNKKDKYDEFMYWNADSKLSWSDFKGKPATGTSEEAMTASSVQYNYSISGGKIQWQVYAKFYPNASWKSLKVYSDYLLQHEQLHFDISELYARMLRKQLTEKIKSSKDASLLKKIGDSIINAWDIEQDAYDRETNHSMNEKSQAIWQAKIHERLAELQEFASP